MARTRSGICACVCLGASEEETEQGGGSGKSKQGSSLGALNHRVFDWEAVTPGRCCDQIQRITCGLIDDFIIAKILIYRIGPKIRRCFLH